MDKELFNFYNDLLLIKKVSIPYDSIKKEVWNNVSELKAVQNCQDLSGFCKYLAINIGQSLQKLGVRITSVNIKDLFGDAVTEHVFLLANFTDNDLNKIALVDPTYQQFMPSGNSKLRNVYQEYPGIVFGDNEVRRNLLNDGISIIDSESFAQYLGSFINQKTYDEEALNKILFDNYERKNK